MTTEEIIIHIFYHVDNAMKDIGKVPQAKLYPSEVVTIGILFALKGGHFRAFYRWLKRDYDDLFAGLPDRTTLLRQLRSQQNHADQLLAEPDEHHGQFPDRIAFPLASWALQATTGREKQG